MCSEIVELDHRECSNDIVFANYFSEDLVEGDMRQNRCLNPNRKTHDETFFKKCKESLDFFNMEIELNEIKVQFNRAKIE